MNTFTTTTNENANRSQVQILHKAVSEATLHLLDSQGSKERNLYKSLLDIIEPPLLDVMMAHFRYNQFKVAEILGLSRSTLRKKLTKHFSDKYCASRKIMAEEQQGGRY